MCPSLRDGWATAPSTSLAILERGHRTQKIAKLSVVALSSGWPRHARGTDERRHPALPGCPAQGRGPRPDHSGTAGPGRSSVAPVVRHVSAPKIPAVDATAAEPGDGRFGRGRGGRAAHDPADGPTADSTAVIRPGLPTHAPATQ